MVKDSKISYKSRFNSLRITYNTQHRFQYSTKLRRLALLRTLYVTHFTIA